MPSAGSIRRFQCCSQPATATAPATPCSKALWCCTSPSSSRASSRPCAKPAHGRSSPHRAWLGRCPCNYSTLPRGVDRHLAIAAVIATDRSSSDLWDLRVPDHLLPFGDVRLDVGGERGRRHPIRFEANRQQL